MIQSEKVRTKQENNYYLYNLLSPDEIEDFEKLSSELGAIMEFIHISDDKEKLRDIIKARGKNFIRNMAL